MLLKRWWLRLLLILAAFGCLFVSAILIHIQFSFQEKMYSAEDVPFTGVGIVLGAGLRPDGSPSDALIDRLLTAAELYRTQKIDRLLISGDDGQFHSNELAVMQPILIGLGVPPEALLLDGHAYRTYESCRRAKQVYQVDEAVLITQRFHLARALFLCERLGIHATGVFADSSRTHIPLKAVVRDLLASLKAYGDIYLVAPASPVPSMANRIYVATSTPDAI